MKDILASVRMLFWMTLLCGGLYPLLSAGISRACFKSQADGSLMSQGEQVLGSSLLSQKFSLPKYFWERPSAVAYNPQPSGASNYGPTSAALKAAYTYNMTSTAAANPGLGDIPQDLLFASASGVDPDISPEAARYQIPRVAKARGFNAAQSQNLAALVESSIEAPDLGVLGQPRVNVLKLNLALDAMKP